MNRVRALTYMEAVNLDRINMNPDVAALRLCHIGEKMSLKIYYVQGTHWDREWYMPFQQLRKYLIDTAEGVLNTLEDDPDFACFVFDGQTLVLEDILEVKPEWRERLRRQIQTGRLKIGPWYCMPDMFLVSGESLIRNLQFGKRIADEFGGGMLPCGYMCDVFGNIAQAPQLLRLSGLELAAAWRGIADENCNFRRWQAPDGSEVLLYRMEARQSYCDFTGDVAGYWDIPLGEEEFKRRAYVHIEELRKRNPELVILMDAVDHGPIHRAVPQYLRWLRELYPQATVEFSDFSQIGEDLAERRESLPLFRGEMVYPGIPANSFQAVLTHTLSARYPMKRWNDICSDLLELELEPVMAASLVRGIPCRPELLRLAWQYLLRNHPHDSICGCSIDAVHQDMLYRFRQIQELRPVLTEDFLKFDRDRLTGVDQRAECVACGFTPGVEIAEADPEGRYDLRVYNPLPLKYSGVIRAEVRFPLHYPKQYTEYFGYETLNAFRLYDAAGREIPYTIEAVLPNCRCNFHRYDFRHYDVYTISFAAELRGCAWHTFRILPADTPVRDWSSMKTGELCASNGLIAVELKKDGTFAVTDCENGRRVEGFNTFMIDRDMGDGWNYAKPVNSGTLLDSNCGVQLRLLHDSAIRTVFEIERQYVLTQALEFRGGIHRQFCGIHEEGPKTTLTIRSTVELEAGSRLVKLTTDVDNTVKDCRIRLAVPTGLAGGYFAGQSFYVTERPEGRLTGDESIRFREFDPEEKNFSGIAGKRSEAGSTVFMSRYGLKEISCRGDKLYVTLLRNFRRTPQTNGEAESQNPGTQRFEYAYGVFPGQAGNAALAGMAQQYRSGFLSYLVRHGGNDVEHRSLLELDGAAVLSAFAPTRDHEPGSAIVRLVNLSDTMAEARLKSDYQLEKVEKIDLHEDNPRPADLSLTLSAWEIATFKLRWRLE